MLNDVQISEILKEFEKVNGCPMNASDRLHAFAIGAGAMLGWLKDRVSTDATSDTPKL
ncbi:MAG: hypothetical protein IT366_21505 [Candidatus Hydrogenedentes bacterium]|nr:hypothetical protein [Candidatus Hydrogenedentota bacterium]